MKPAATPDVRRGSSQPNRMMSGLRKMPPPVPVSPASSPRPAPAGRVTAREGGLRLALRQPRRLPEQPRRRGPEQQRRPAADNSSGGRWMPPPMKAAGAAVSDEGGEQAKVDLARPASSASAPNPATTRLSASAVGRIVSGATANSAMIAR